MLPNADAELVTVKTTGQFVASLRCHVAAAGSISVCLFWFLPVMLRMWVGSIATELVYSYRGAL